MTVVDISAPVLRWAQRRSGRPDQDMYDKFESWSQWLSLERKPTFSEVEDIAKFTRVPIGYLFLPEPPIEELPIPDFRVGRGESIQASDDLLDTIYLNQRRQAWYEDYVADFGDPTPLSFVGSANGLTIAATAKLISETLGFSIRKRAELRTATHARNFLITEFERLGGLVVINSMVGNNTHRMLDLEEFRGFTLHSLTAPLVFINGRDTKNGQVFSLLHEFAHIWHGDSGVSSGGTPLLDRANPKERWCDSVAAEIAVPSEDLKVNFNPDANITSELERLSNRYLCSTLVILLKLQRETLIPKQGFSAMYDEEVERLLKLVAQEPQGNGGDFYNNQPFRVGQTLSRAIIRDTKSGTTPVTEALRLLSFKSAPMLDRYAERLGEV